MQALLGFTSEARWLRHVHTHLWYLFRYLPKQPGYNKRLRAADGLIRAVYPSTGHRHHAMDRRRGVADSTSVDAAGRKRR